MISLAGRAEQEIRAYPQLHRAFYSLVVRSPALRAAAGRAKDSVRVAAGGTAVEPAPTDEPDVVRRRLQATAARLGL